MSSITDAGATRNVPITARLISYSAQLLCANNGNSRATSRFCARQVKRDVVLRRLLFLVKHLSRYSADDDKLVQSTRYVDIRSYVYANLLCSIGDSKYVRKSHRRVR